MTKRQQMTTSEFLLMVFAFTVAFLLVKPLLRDAPERVRDVGIFGAILATMLILVWFGVLRRR